MLKSAAVGRVVKSPTELLVSISMTPLWFSRLNCTLPSPLRPLLQEARRKRGSSIAAKFLIFIFLTIIFIYLLSILRCLLLYCPDITNMYRW